MLRSFSLRRGRDLAILAVVLSLVAGLLWWTYLYSPVQERITVLENEIARLESEIALGERARADLPALRGAVAQLERERLAFLAQLPHESEIAELIVLLQNAAGRSEVVIQGINRTSGTHTDIVGVRPIDFSLSTGGTYTQLMDFLQEVEALQRFTLINQVGLSLVSGDEYSDPALSGNIAFTAYVFVGEDPGDQPLGDQPPDGQPLGSQP
ncbi:MAG: type 4a pilus biogenesis protein PilO [Deinococcota bacterium]|jgi:Tfp pilus assembly protein PilO|nr:type 4a pilus biogenesis protein PilO [Deinococcota bacterium]